jgi:metal-responsive CopG/Arc/MetJ family transcriptional regulator
MPSKLPVMTFIVDEDLKRRLDDFRFSQRIDTKSDAIRRLLNEALKKYEKKASVQNDD